MSAFAVNENMPQVEDKTNIFIITAPKVVDTGKLSFRFMGVAWNALSRNPVNIDQFGVLRTRPYGKDEINPFSAVRGGPAQTAPERIEMTICGNGRGIIYHCSMDHHPGKVEAIPQPDGFDGLPLDGFVLLTERKLFDEVVFSSFHDMFPGLRYAVHHHDQELSTS